MTHARDIVVAGEKRGTFTALIAVHGIPHGSDMATDAPPWIIVRSGEIDSSGSNSRI